ncbi:PREDICTED: armadillo repeat-containing protein 2 [Gekko japonicus]|uniref:Armadillo repeat-containing protein 2 n=1 Tax=Gekko japonicus TaxID=146911 RepID=A0ABM1JHF0_GEKJA|nr:PREDICTED: armadillo repeat-containing protein 2 [Gekko japonicus]
MSSKNKKLENSEAFYRPSLAVQKTSAEIINEARNALRTLRTRRPFTPREEQRKLFGSASSRTPENRPPSSFSLHASSFESVEPRPVSCARLSPLDHKPKLLLSLTSNEDYHIPPPKLPVDSEEIEKVRNARTCLFRTASHGNLLNDKIFSSVESKRLSFEGQTTLSDVPRSDECFPAKLTVQSGFEDEGLPLAYKDKVKQACSEMREIATPSQDICKSLRENKMTAAVSNDGADREPFTRTELRDIFASFKEEIMGHMNDLMKQMNDKLETLQISINNTTQTAETALDTSLANHEDILLLQSNEKWLKEKVLTLEHKAKEKCLKFRGFPEKSEKTEDLLTFITNWLSEMAFTTSDSVPILTKAYRLGVETAGKDKGPRDILVEFLDVSKKSAVLKVARDKRFLKFGEHNILVFPDLPSEVLQIRRALKPITKCLIEAQVRYRCDQDHPKRSGRPSSCPENSIWIKADTKTENNLGANETEEEENYWNMRILPILHELETEDNVESLCHACDILYRALEDRNMLGKRFKRRTLFLKTLYKLCDIASDPLGLKLAKIILGLKVSGKNLLNVCKLVFKISRNEKNDCLIQSDQILDSLLEVLRAEDLQANTEAFIYCIGALKFISGNTSLIHEMVNKGTVEILVQFMKQINLINENEAQFCSSGHLLVQLTATLRNLVDLPQSRCKLLSSGAIPELCLMMEERMNDKDICTNVARIFSKLSSFNDCCSALADCSRCYILFLALLNKHPKKQDLVVRVIFILGNLTARNNQAREQFFEMQGSINTLITLFQTHCDIDSNSKPCQDDGELRNVKHPSEAEDVLIKLVRVIANLSIHPSVGASLATNHQILGLLIKVLEYKSVDKCEELVINTTATINNLSYYHVKNSVILEKKLYIAELLIKLLMSSNMDGILEAVRVFGNLSQYDEICDFIVQRKVYKFMIALLDAKHQDVCFSACGVLLNLTVDRSRRTILNEEDAIKKLIDCLRDFGPTDWQLACLICKTLWNYSENVTSARPCLEEEDSNTLLILLASFLDEEFALDYNLDSDLRDYHKLHWESEFKPVAQKLLQRIQN